MKEKNIHPFDLHTARRIHDGQIPGKIITVREEPVRILCWDACIEHFRLVGLVRMSSGQEKLLSFTEQGRTNLQLEGVYDLRLLLTEDIPYKPGDILKHADGIDEQSRYSFKPFDKVLVRDGKDLKWTCNIFSHIDADNKRNPYRCVILNWPFILPYNDQTKHLVGTTDNWEEK